jgi:hypothetical protein
VIVHDDLPFPLVQRDLSRKRISRDPSTLVSSGPPYAGQIPSSGEPRYSGTAAASGRAPSSKTDFIDGA